MGSLDIGKRLFLNANACLWDLWDQYSRLTCAISLCHPAPLFHVIGEAPKIGPNDPKPLQRFCISLENNRKFTGSPGKCCPQIRDQWDQWRARDLIRVQGCGDWWAICPAGSPLLQPSPLRFHHAQGVDPNGMRGGFTSALVRESQRGIALPARTSRPRNRPRTRAPIEASHLRSCALQASQETAS